MTEQIKQEHIFTLDWCWILRWELIPSLFTNSEQTPRPFKLYTLCVYSGQLLTSLGPLCKGLYRLQHLWTVIRPSKQFFADFCLVTKVLVHDRITVLAVFYCYDNSVATESSQENHKNSLIITTFMGDLVSPWKYFLKHFISLFDYHATWNQSCVSDCNFFLVWDRNDNENLHHSSVDDQKLINNNGTKSFQILPLRRWWQL